MTNPKADRFTAYTGFTLLTRVPTIPTMVWGHRHSFSQPHQENHGRIEILTEATPPRGQLPTVPLPLVPECI